MNRLAFCFGYGGSGEDGIGASGATPVDDLDIVVRRTVERAADGDVFVELRSADPDSRAEVTVHLNEDEARALADQIAEIQRDPTDGFPIGADFDASTETVE